MSRARTAIAMCFLAQGFCFAALLTQVNVLKERFSFSDGELSLVLLVVPVVAGAGSVLAGALAARYGSAPVLRAGGLLVAASVAGTGAAPRVVLLFVALAGLGVGLGAVDATMNMQGSALEAERGRPLLSSLHGVWSISAMAGALGTAATAGLGIATAWALAGAGAAGAALSLTAGPRLLRRDRSAGTVSGGRAGPVGGAVAVPAEAVPAEDVPAEAVPAEDVPAEDVPWRPVVLIGIAMMFVFVADSATSNWSAVFLDDALSAGPAVAALGLFAYQLFMVIGRLTGDRLVRRLGMVAVVRAGAVAGCAGLLVVATAPHPAVGVVGFAVQGAGLCVVVPLSFSAAGRLDPPDGPPGVAIARVNLFNYAGFVIGAGLIGAVAELADLRLAYVVPAVLTAVVVVLARYYVR